MNHPQLTITYVGGPTALLDFGGVRLLTDPTFDSPGSDYTTGPVTLTKLSGPAVTAEELGRIDYVLLSHDHHFDNLDRSGRAQLPNAKKVLTTEEGAQRLGGNSIGLKDWQSITLPTAGGRTLRVVATPAQHGPTGLSRGPVIGFVLFFEDAPEHAIYISGDTVWFPGVAEVARRYQIETAILNLGAARVPAVGNFHLTMTADEAIQVALAFPNATIVPLHFEDWAHFSENRQAISRAFTTAKLAHRLQWPERGQNLAISQSGHSSAAAKKLG